MRVSALFVFLLAICSAQKTLPRDKRCLSKNLRHLMVDVVDEVSTSPSFNSSRKTVGVIANILKRRIQLRFSRIFEIVVSHKNFALSTHGVSDQFCKIYRKGVYALVYETPHQTGYHAKDKEIEMEFSSISDLDPLGTSQTSLPGQQKDSGVELEPNGYRLGFPKGSHCDEGRRGGFICCHQDLFHSMRDTVLDMEEDDSYFSVDHRIIAQRIRRNAEVAINQPLETVVSPNDFEVVSHHVGDCVCKFKAGGNTLMAWRTPGNWSIGVDLFADNGRSRFRGCNRTEKVVKRGWSRPKDSGCCNQTLQYTIIRNLEEAVGGLNGGEMVNVNEVSRALARSTQKQLNSHVETIVSLGDFVYSGGYKNESEQACKLDLLQFHVLMFKSPGKPLVTEFLTSDVEPSNALETLNSPSNTVHEGDVVAQNAPNSPNQASNVNPNNQPVQQAPLQQAPPQQNVLSQQIVQQQSFLQNLPMQFAQPPFNSPAQGFAPQNSFAVQAPPPAFSGGAEAAGFAGGAPAAEYYPLYQAYQCFSEDTWVVTEKGKKNMSSLEIGDFVLTADAKRTFFSPVTLWLHRDKDVESGFIEITTVAERKLFISPRHFIFRTLCNVSNSDNLQSLPEIGEVFAQELIPGDCIYTHEEAKWKLEKVSNLKMKKRKGIFAPLTENGRIVVNGVLASCFTDFHYPILQNVYFEFVAVIRRNLFGWFSDAKVGTPSFLHIFEELLWIALPYTSRIA